MNGQEYSRSVGQFMGGGFEMEVGRYHTMMMVARKKGLEASLGGLGVVHTVYEVECSYGDGMGWDGTFSGVKCDEVCV